ncbi:MAG: GNAT family N-acetyltransferase [Bdellovibrionaceae bacterium]|nr:GNAT family N-acetyltransferase [Pseudobdellovibrionaceae bacterium]
MKNDSNLILQIKFFDIGHSDLDELYPLITEFYPNLTAKNIHDNLTKMIEFNKYTILTASVDGLIAGFLGYIKLTNLIYDDYFWVHDLIVKKQYRSNGIGKKLLEELHQIAQKEQISHIALSTHIDHASTHRFYETKMNYEKRGFVYRASASLFKGQT